MVVSGNIGDLIENAIERCIIHQLDVMRMLRRNDEIKWNNLEIKNGADFIKGYLLTEIVHDFASNFRMMHKRILTPPEILEAFKIIMGRADDIKKAITDIGS
jgi:hypothetical protein